ncbi:sensor histidine kinase KdpD [Bacteroides sp. 519]|uniref:sensor histidine kinase n=1 Tax=Bacteroides sp. 519 TaxID=2302937 RepID=UPI0013D3A03E|nr:ATP-binding protein [Bacteroides sp. 519]NDV59631.1 sensor histidine kinase [Bacteroides sp. 519]
MEKRIRVVWVLSLLSALLLIGVQAYWLYNQYEFVLDAYSEELAQEMYKVGYDDFMERKKKVKSNYSYVINTNLEGTSYGDEETHKDLKKIAFAFIYDKDSLLSKTQKKEQLSNILSRIDSLDYSGEEILPFNDKDQALSLSINRDLPQDSIQLFMDMAVTNHFSPFSKARFDSLLTAHIPGHSFTMLDWPQNDSIYRISWTRTGHITNPGLQVAYAYSPFQKEGIIVETAIPVEPLFTRMAVQLFLAFSLILILIGCLVFQIKTILKQKKIGELRQNFVNTMIHELKRPVQTLKTFVSFLGDKDMRSDEIITEQVIQDSMFELDNLSAYLNKLKDMVRADSDDTPLTLVHFDLHELTEKVIRLINIPNGKQVEFSRYFDMESPMIDADPIHLANVLSNLIENAIKYSGDKVNIEIKARKKGNELWLTVSDNGIGIPVVEQDRVFAKFYRGSNLPDNNIPGLGLGLSYVKLISEAHQGRVSLQSHIGEGTSITLFIPQ